MSIIEFDLARAMTSGQTWPDPDTIKGGKPGLTPADIRAAVSMSLVDHPFAFHALMAKYCDDRVSKQVLQASMDEYGSLVYLEMNPNYGLKGKIHNKLIEFSIKVYFTPTVYARLTDTIGTHGLNQKAADYVGVHRDTWVKRYKSHFDLITSQLFELEVVAKADYRRIMK